MTMSQKILIFFEIKVGHSTIHGLWCVWQILIQNNDICLKSPTTGQFLIQQWFFTSYRKLKLKKTFSIKYERVFMAGKSVVKKGWDDVKASKYSGLFR